MATEAGNLVYRLSLVLAALVAVAGVYVLSVSRDTQHVFGAIAAFLVAGMFVLMGRAARAMFGP